MRTLFCVMSGVVLLSVHCYGAINLPIDDFVMAPYSQKITDYFSPQADDYDQPLVSVDYQKTQLHQFYQHNYADDDDGLSPWSERFVQAVLLKVYTQQIENLEQFDNQNKPFEMRHFAENFKEHDAHWFQNIKNNMNLDALSTQFQFEQRAIAVANTQARALPDSAPDFYHPSLAGQGFPFDNLQASAIWVGTPLYVVHRSLDQAWSLVLTPDAYFAWVKSSDIADVSHEFVAQWQHIAQQHLVAVTTTAASILDQHQKFQGSVYIGAIFPLVAQDQNELKILIPVKNEHHQAIVKQAFIAKTSAAEMPLAMTPRHMGRILEQLQNRPYGWGGIYWFNDCSAELKSIFTPFGIWMPRNTGQQVKRNTALDLSAMSMDERLQSLQEKGHPMLTAIYLGGHVMLYLGTKTIDDIPVAMTYQNIWGLAPLSRDKRYVIGRSVFLPLLKSYPDNPDANSLANQAVFKLIFWDQLPDTLESPEVFAARYF